MVGPLVCLLRAAGGLFKKAWRWADRYFTLTDLLDLFGWKAISAAVGSGVITVVWGVLTGWAGPLLFVLAIWAVAGVAWISVVVEKKRDLKFTGLVEKAIAEAEAEGRAAVKRRHSEADAEGERAEAEQNARRRRALGRLVELRDDGKTLAEVARAGERTYRVQSPYNHSTHETLDILNRRIQNWVERVSDELRHSFRFEDELFMNCGDSPAVGRYSCHMKNLEEIIVRLTRQVSGKEGSRP